MREMGWEYVNEYSTPWIPKPVKKRYWSFYFRSDDESNMGAGGEEVLFDMFFKVLFGVFE